MLDSVLAGSGSGGSEGNVVVDGMSGRAGGVGQQQVALRDGCLE